MGKLSTSEIRRITNNWSESGSLTLNRRNQILKFGAQYRVQQLNDRQLDDPSGQYTFNQRFTSVDPLRSTSASGSSVASFLLGYPFSGSIGRGERLALEQKYAGFFFHDDWKVTSKLTLNLGIRYNLEFGPTERFNRESWLDWKERADRPVRPLILVCWSGASFAGSSGDAWEGAGGSSRRFLALKKISGQRIGVKSYQL